MLRMVSYSHRPKSGQITCYLNRTYHVLTTIVYFSLDILGRVLQTAGVYCDSSLHFLTPMTRTQRSFIRHFFPNFFLGFLVLSAPVFLSAGDQVPATAWRIPIGQPPAYPGGRKPELANIDDGFWQGAPVGGIGAGTFSRSYRGNFERWHIKAGVHKYQSVPAY